jgi:hypothetical protein
VLWGISSFLPQLAALLAKAETRRRCKHGEMLVVVVLVDESGIGSFVLPKDCVAVRSCSALDFHVSSAVLRSDS